MGDDERDGKRTKRTLEEVFGSVKPLRPDVDIDEMIRIAKEERAMEFAKKFRAV